MNNGVSSVGTKGCRNNEQSDRQTHSVTTITMICMYCKKFLYTTDGEGVYGLSHGICERCTEIFLKREIRRLKGEIKNKS
jgi:hypothetical protein